MGSALYKNLSLLLKRTWPEEDKYPSLGITGIITYFLTPFNYSFVFCVTTHPRNIIYTSFYSRSIKCTVMGVTRRRA